MACTATKRACTHPRKVRIADKGACTAKGRACTRGREVYTPKSRAGIVGQGQTRMRGGHARHKEGAHGTKRAHTSEGKPHMDGHAWHERGADK
jgi:hypothetical protein